MSRSLSVIAADVHAHWPKVNYAAAPYLEAMGQLQTMADAYGLDSASSVVAYFLANAGGWRGPDAQRIKKELNAMLHPEPTRKRSRPYVDPYTIAKRLSERNSKS